MSSRTRGQRISRPELIRDSRAALIQAGVGNHSRALFVSEISRDVVGSEHPAYAQLQPHIKKRDTEAWERAYVIVNQYLALHNLKITLDTTTIETRVPPPKPSLEDSTADEQLGDLLDSAPPKLRVKDRIAKAKQTQGAAKPRGKAAAAEAEAAKPAPKKGATAATAATAGSALPITPAKGDKEEPTKKTPATSTRKAGAKPIQKRATAKGGPTPSKDGPPLVIASPASGRKDLGSESEPSDFIIEDVKPARKKK